jgi:hypothetical protein
MGHPFPEESLTVAGTLFVLNENAANDTRHAPRHIRGVSASHLASSK